MRSRLLVAAIAAAAIFGPASLAQEKPSDEALRDKWRPAYQKVAESIEMRSGGAVLKMHDRPLLFYTNPVVDTDQHGAIFLWTGMHGLTSLLISLRDFPWPDRDDMAGQFRELQLRALARE